MLAIYLILAAAGAAVLFLSRRETGRLVERTGKFLYKKYIMYGGWGKGAGRKNERNRKLEEELELLNPGTDGRQEANCYMEHRIGEGFLFIWICSMLALALHIQSVYLNQPKEEFIIERSAYGDRGKELELLAQSGERKERIQLCVEPRKFTKEETEALYRQFLPKLEEHLLADNAGPDEVRGPVQLLSELEGFPFFVEWNGDSKGLIGMDGSLQNDEIGTDGVITVLRARIVYEEFVREYEFSLRILPPLLTEAEQFRKKLIWKTEEAEAEKRSEPIFRLPDEVEGMPLLWTERKEDQSIVCLLLGIAAAVLLFWGREEERKKKIAAREKYLTEAYPELVTKMALLLGAGMTVRAAFRKIAGGERNILAEEMRMVCHEMDSGVPESQAYIRFGKRCRLKQYMKFSTLLTQNLKKGSNGLLAQLEREAHEAMEERKSRARKLGEEAGTKLLLPMSGMLIVTMLLIIIPAFGGFGL